MEERIKTVDLIAHVFDCSIWYIATLKNDIVFLHNMAKIAFQDRKKLFIGKMNLTKLN